MKVIEQTAFGYQQCIALEWTLWEKEIYYF